MNRALLLLFALPLLLAASGCDSAAPDPSDPTDPADGRWTYMSGPYAVLYEIEDDGGALSGRVFIAGAGVAEDDPITGTRSGRQVQFSYPLQFQGNTATLFLTLAADGTTMSGYGTNTSGGREEGIVLTLSPAN